MLTYNKKGILLMNPVRIDRSLMKFQEVSEEELHKKLDEELGIKYYTDTDVELVNSRLSGLNINRGFISRTNNLHSYNGIPFRIKYTNGRDNIINKLSDLYLSVKIFFYKTFTKFITDEEFFELVKSNDEELSKLSKEDFEKLSIKMKKMSYQKATLDNIGNKVKIRFIENKLVDNGLTRYIEEINLVKFIKMTNGGLSLIEIQYFPYEIPDSVQDNIRKADELKLFDNFYILFKLPEFAYMDKESSKIINKQTEEIKKDNDPIVFGVLDGSTKLYFIDDWITDYCDLTFDSIIKKIGTENEGELTK